MSKHIAQVDKRQSRVIALAAGTPAAPSRLSASLSLLAITFLSLAGWAVLGGLAYWTLG